MEAAVIILGVVAILAMGLVVVLVFQLSNARSAGGNQDGNLDHQVKEMRDGLENVGKSIQDLKTDRTAQSSEMKGLMTNIGSQMTALNSTNAALREALANSRVRGQWGERMAEDVFRVIGFLEGTNYDKQVTIPGSESGAGSRPDFTIHLPQHKKLNMDVKFPLENYMKFMDAETKEAEEQARNSFLKDVRDRLKEVVGREYIDPSQGTLDYVLVFIPNEQVYAFIQQHGAATIDEALRNKVVLCSPMSLFAILGVIRQAMDNFALEQDSNEILSQLGAFNKQWTGFVRQLETVRSRIESAQKNFETLAGTRLRALQRPLNRIEAIRVERGLPIASDNSEIIELPEPELADALADGD
ncbi:MAG: DNA recombination protein RmuC [SAR202 cluster bacterium]|nr:DNA recombination protein RmuC [SAR202 cluster bacterium]